MGRNSDLYNKIKDLVQREIVKQKQLELLKLEIEITKIKTEILKLRRFRLLHGKDIIL